MFEAGKRTSTVEADESAEGVDAELCVIHGAPHAWAAVSAYGSTPMQPVPTRARQ